MPGVQLCIVCSYISNKLKEDDDRLWDREGLELIVESCARCLDVYLNFCRLKNIIPLQTRDVGPMKQDCEFCQGREFLEREHPEYFREDRMDICRYCKEYVEI